MTQPRTLRLIVLTTFIIVGLLILADLPISKDTSKGRAAEMTAEERGLWNLQHKQYGQPLMNKLLLQLLANKAWEPEWKAKIDPNDADSVRKVAFERYGFCEATWDNQGAPLQFVANKEGRWAQTCMLCH